MKDKQVSAPKFTAGPLRLGNEADADRVAIISDEVGTGYFGVVGIAIERVSHPLHGGEVSRKTAIANATLWAAAPEMYAACKAALACPELNWQEMDDVSRGAVESLRAAIAKAEGGTV